MKLMCFADHLDSLLLIFCSISFILPLVPIISFCSHLILMSKKMHLIHKFVVFKGCGQPKTLQLLCIPFYRIKENILHPTPTIKFSRIFYLPPPVYSNLPPRLLRFEEFSTPPHPRLFQPALLLGTQE